MRVRAAFSLFHLFFAGVLFILRPQSDWSLFCDHTDLIENRNNNDMVWHAVFPSTLLLLVVATVAALQGCAIKCCTLDDARMVN